jgi:hypothetical protein
LAIKTIVAAFNVYPGQLPMMILVCNDLYILFGTRAILPKSAREATDPGAMKAALVYRYLAATPIENHGFEVPCSTQCSRPVQPVLGLSFGCLQWQPRCN